MTMVRGMSPSAACARLPRSISTSLGSRYGSPAASGAGLAVLARIADLLAVLYCRGVVYGDLNPNNLMVSVDAGGHEIWLIDTDNMKYAGDRGTPYTPGVRSAGALGLPGTSRRSNSTPLTLGHAFEMITGSSRPFLDGRQLDRTRPGRLSSTHTAGCCRASSARSPQSQPILAARPELLLSPRSLTLSRWKASTLAVPNRYGRPTAGESARSLWRQSTSFTNATSGSPGGGLHRMSELLLQRSTRSAPVVSVCAAGAPISTNLAGEWGQRSRGVASRALLAAPASHRRRSGLRGPAFSSCPPANTAYDSRGSKGATVTNRGSCWLAAQLGSRSTAHPRLEAWSDTP